MQPNQRIIVALDVDRLDTVGDIIEKVSPYVGAWKIGMQLCTRVGTPQAVEFIHQRGGKVFFDHKFKDISNTVAKAAAASAALGVMMFNVHADGGSKMMKDAKTAVDEQLLAYGGTRPLMLGVTVLTSMNAEVLQEIGYHHEMTVEEQVQRLAMLAENSGCDGVVASAREVSMIRQMCGKNFLIVTPAVQPPWAAAWLGDTDQKRATTHIEAFAAGADHLVIGRAILKSPDPVGTAKRIADELNSTV